MKLINKQSYYNALELIKTKQASNQEKREALRLLRFYCITQAMGWSDVLNAIGSYNNTLTK